MKNALSVVLLASGLLFASFAQACEKVAQPVAVDAIHLCEMHGKC